MIQAGKIQEYSPQVCLTCEGAYETTFFILMEGEVQVTKTFNDDEDRLLKILKPGDFFGEMAIIHDAPRAATITTLTPVVVLEIEKEAFSDLLEHSSSMSVAMVREVSRRLRENDDMAIEDLRLKARELADAYYRLSQQDQARRQFLTTIAHELRTPLMAANGFLHMIRSGSLQGSALTSALDTVARNLQEITTLTNDILFLQEMELILPEFQPTDLGRVVAGVVENYRQKAESSRVGLGLQIDPGRLTVLADSKSLARALSAVIDNAIKFSPSGGDVLVSVGQAGEWICVTVSDHGVGIPDDTLPLIFDRFFHLDQVEGHLFRGAGLGLSIARQVIEQHHGSITAESQLGAGSRFTIYLKPVAHPTSA